MEKIRKVLKRRRKIFGIFQFGEKKLIILIINLKNNIFVSLYYTPHEQNLIQILHFNSKFHALIELNLPHVSLFLAFKQLKTINFFNLIS